MTDVMKPKTISKMEPKVFAVELQGPSGWKVGDSERKRNNPQSHLNRFDPQWAKDSENFFKTTSHRQNEHQHINTSRI